MRWIVYAQIFNENGRTVKEIERGNANKIKRKMHSNTMNNNTTIKH